MSSLTTTCPAVNVEAWRRTWRLGIVPQLSPVDLQALGQALRQDDARLITGETCRPCWMPDDESSPVTHCDPLALVAVLSRGLTTVADVEAFWAELCFEADMNLGEPSAIRWFLNWLDETPRADMRAQLLAEVDLALAGHTAAAA